MDRRTFIGGVAIGLVAAPHSAGAQPTGRKAGIGILAGGSSDANAMHFLTGPLQQGLRDLGYVEAQNIAFEYRWADGKTERLPALAAELVRLDVDVIFAANPQAARAAKNATSTIPIVFTGVGDPVAEGLVASLSRPGGNVTGCPFPAASILRESACSCSRSSFRVPAGSRCLRIPTIRRMRRR